MLFILNKVDFSLLKSCFFVTSDLHIFAIRFERRWFKVWIHLFFHGGKFSTIIYINRDKSVDFRNKAHMKLSHPELLVPHPGRWVDWLVLMMLFDFYSPPQFPPAFIDFLGRKHCEILTHTQCVICWNPKEWYVCLLIYLCIFSGSRG